MGNTFNQTNQPGSIGTQGQVGDNTLNLHNANDALQPLKDELQSALQGKEWNDSTPPELTEEFATPADMIDSAINEAKLEIDIAAGKETQLETSEQVPPTNDEERKSAWAERFKALIPLGTKVVSSAAMAVLSSYSPASPVLVAILKTLTNEVLETEHE